jgi:putative NADH-flavin reductase
MKIAILGASGMVGQRVVREALSRNHSVTAVSRKAAPLGEPNPRLTTAAADATRADELERTIAKHDAVLSAVGPRGDAPAMLVDVTRAVAAAAMKTDVRRIVIVGGAGSLSVKPGLELLATPDFPAGWRDLALAHREALELWRRVKELDWTYVSPAAVLEPGTRTGKYRTGHDDLLVDERGESRISAEDLAVALIDELEHHAHSHERITVAY